MADNNFRGARGRASFAHEDERDPREALRDPLAELARLIGQADPRQSEPRGDLNRDARPNPESFDDAPRPLGADYAADHGRTKPGRYAADGQAEPQSQPLDPHLPPHDYGQPEGATPRFNVREPSIAPEDAEYYDDGQGEAPSHDAPYRDNARYPDEDMPEIGGRRSRALPPLPPQSYDDGYDGEEQWQDEGDDQSYADQEEYEDDGEGRPRRRGLTALVAILMLAGVGAAGAYAYRTVFGGAMLPTLPPVIRANDGPNRIMPPQATASAEADVANSGTGEQLMPREEQPVQIQPQDASPRSVSTVPVAPQNAALASSPPDGSPFPASPIMAPPPASSTPQIATEPAPGPGGPKKIHTVLIRPDQQASAGGAGVNLPSTPPPQQASRTKPAPTAKNGHAPLAITPDGQASAPAPDPQPPAQRTQLARAEPATRTPATAAPAPAVSAPAAGGSFNVQVTSQRSEQDAQTAFQALQAKYPDQLGSRQAIIRQVDLGDKGVYFRAMVGPYGSRTEAANMCMTLKAAGGSCLVQPN
jgi:hypothetical protein